MALLRVYTRPLSGVPVGGTLRIGATLARATIVDEYTFLVSTVINPEIAKDEIGSSTDGKETDIEDNAHRIEDVDALDQSNNIRRAHDDQYGTDAFDKYYSITYRGQHIVLTKVHHESRLANEYRSYTIHDRHVTFVNPGIVRAICQNDFSTILQYS